MVVSIHPLASQVGVDIMKQGGNAVDAAVAVGFALAVVHPSAGNIGGGGFLLLRKANGDVHFLDYREKAPAAATEKMYLDASGKVVDDLSLVGYKAIAVPGSVAGMAEAQKKWGKLPLKAVMAPAIRLARKGFAITNEEADDLRDANLSKFPESKRIFQRNGNYYKAGEVLKQPELARTLERIAANPGDFYRGALAREFAAAMKKGGGLITEKDLAQYEVKERAAIHGTYRGYDIYSAPPPSSGGIVLMETLNILEGFPLSKLGRSPPALHLTIEAFRRAFFDRAEFLGDPDFSAVPVAQLTDKKYGMAWREQLNPDHASHSADLKRPETFSQLERLATLHPPAFEPEETTHYSVVDPDGNAVAVTTTLNGSYGSAVTAEGLGFLLNNEMDDFASAPGVPNMYGLIQGPANAIGPGKRPLSAMTPTIVTKDGKLFLVAGSPGGPTIITTVANILMGVIDYGMNVQEAVNAPRYHHQWMPDQVRVEDSMPADDLEALGKMGHKFVHRKRWGEAACIAIHPLTGERLGASDPRTNGKATGF
ncbi:MAG TPA: gamma-glutamyltransferase [Terriglobales bacterium]|nr:gamma-glutamyltransferase [Terriglobales bacterium]